MQVPEAVCPSCLRILDTPRRLGCGHNICLQCAHNRALSSLQAPNSNPWIGCPQCKQITKLPQVPQTTSGGHDLKQICLDFVKSLPGASGSLEAAIRDFGSNNGNSNHHNSAPAKMKCPNCELREASVMCGECGPMCEECRKQIHMVKIFQHHVISRLEDSRSESVNAPKCAEHNEASKMFCELCETLVCHLCLLVGTHRDEVTGTPHPCCSAEEAADKAKRKIQSRFTQTPDLLRLIQATQHTVSQHQHDLNVTKSSLIEEVNAHFRQLARELEARRAQVLRDLDAHASAHQISLKCIEVQCVGLISMRELLETRARELLDSSNLLSFQNVLVSRLDETQNLMRSRGSSTPAAANLRFNHTSAPASLFEYEGAITGDGIASPANQPTPMQQPTLSASSATTAGGAPVSGGASPASSASANSNPQLTATTSGSLSGSLSAIPTPSQSLLGPKNRTSIVVSADVDVAQNGTDASPARQALRDKLQRTSIVQEEQADPRYKSPARNNSNRTGKSKVGPGGRSGLDDVEADILDISAQLNRMRTPSLNQSQQQAQQQAQQAQQLAAQQQQQQQQLQLQQQLQQQALSVSNVAAASGYPFSLPHSIVQLLDSSPDILYVGTEGMVRLQLILLDASGNEYPPETHVDNTLVGQSLWVETVAGERTQGEVIVNEGEIVMAFVTAHPGEHYIKTTIGIADEGAPVVIANFIVEADRSPLPELREIQKGLDILESSTPNKLSLRRAGAGWRVALFAKDFTTTSKQTTFFSLQVLIDEQTDSESHPHKMFVGVTEVGNAAEKLCSKQVLNTDLLWGIYVASGKKVHKDREQKIVQGIKGFQKGDVLGLLLETDKDKSVMSLYKNDKPQGLVFRAIPRDLTAVLAITGFGNQMSVIAFEEKNLFPV